ncbi:MAG: PD40 domain-containing protein [Cyclobacteriaceae bacterium]|nr:PD40 domain-containing protein [Cyclobacteriaceae bacterium]
MNLRKKTGAALIFILVLISGIFWFSPEQPLKEGMLIVTAVPSGIDLHQDDMGYDRRYIPEAQIIAVDIQSPQKETILLTDGFYSARSPEVSFNGREMVFSGQKEMNDTWQIYVKDLATLQVRQITHCPVNCTDPAWLPDGRIAFSRFSEEDATGQVHVLYACFPDGSSKERLTYHPNSDISSSVTHDGRILVLSEQKYPSTGQMQILALRVDGTKSELYYKSENGGIPCSRGWESADGRIFFIEKQEGKSGRRKLVSVDHGHPLSSREDLSLNEKGSFFSVFPISGKELCLSYRSENQSTYGLYLFDTENKNIRDELYINPEFHLIEPVIVRERKVPMKLPPVVDSSATKGTLLCHDSDLSMINAEEVTPEENKTHKVQVLGLDGMLGEVKVEEDGSFYVEIDADMPVRFLTLNSKGEILRGPSAWVWVRPNERRSCIGCHEDRELAPENRVPDALYSGMVSLPDGAKVEPIVLSEKYIK